MGRWKINRISEQDALSKITLDRYEQLRRKHEGCRELTYICSQVESELKKVQYLSTAVWNKLSHGKSTLRPFRFIVLGFTDLFTKHLKEEWKMTFPEVTFYVPVSYQVNANFSYQWHVFNFNTLRIWFLYFQGYVLGMTSKLCCLELAQWFHFTWWWGWWWWMKMMMNWCVSMWRALCFT